jgi:hypothetical protein
MPTIPTDREVVEGEIATYWLEDDGTLVSVSKPVRRTVENLSANAELVRRITGGRPAPLLIYLSTSPVPDRAARQLSTALLPQSYSAMAMVSDPGLASFIMNILFSLQPPPIPMRNFTDDQEARAWLRRQAGGAT